MSARHSYYMTVSPLDGSVYVSDYEQLRVLRLMPASSSSSSRVSVQLVAGSGQSCLNAARHSHCGDGRSAVDAQLSHPKGRHHFPLSSLLRTSANV